MGKTSAASLVSKPSAGTGQGTLSKTNMSSKSSILRSAFAPSSLQLHLFASVIQSFDSQLLRIHDTTTGRLRQQHSARPRTTITSLDWGHYAASNRDSNKKKRRRTQPSEDVVVAYGTSDSEVCMYSPAEDRILDTLTGGHEGGIRDFKFSVDKPSEAWSIGGDNKLVQWDLSQNKPIRTINLPDPAISVLASPTSRDPQILCASTTPFSISPSEDFHIGTFDSLKGQVHSIQRSGLSLDGTSELFLAVDNDRYINIFDISQRRLVRTLVTGSEVEKIDCFSGTLSSNSQAEQLLAAITKDGVIELFSHPFKLPSVVNGDIKIKRRNMTRKADAQVKLVADGRRTSPIFTASLQGPDLVIVSVDGGIEPTFQQVRWQDEGSGELLFDGIKEVAKSKRTSVLSSAQMNGFKNMGKTHVDESRTVVVNGFGDLVSQDTPIEISSEDEDEAASGDSDSETNDKEEHIDDEASSPSDVEMEEADAEALALVKTGDVQGTEDTERADEKTQEPSFGDLIALRHPNTIAIADSFAQEKPVYDAGKQLALPSGMSLGTVLTQALRTNDTNLLESCLHANDSGIIQNTIQRLDSTLASNLLSKLAERLASRPGRYGHLLSWVQWTCIAHGGAIAGQPDVANKIRTLYKVLSQRSKSLDKLLLLKGKLDMLDAQLALRKQIQSHQGTDTRDRGEPGMVYIEGGESNWSSDDEDEAVGTTKKVKTNKRSRRALEDLVADGASSEDIEDNVMPTTNGPGPDDSDEEEESDEETYVKGRTKGGLYDVEAEVSGEEGSEDDEEEDDGDEIEGSDEGEDDEEEDDSSMDSFINDGEISYASEEDEIDLDDEPAAHKPEKKKGKHR